MPDRDDQGDDESDDGGKSEPGLHASMVKRRMEYGPLNQTAMSYPQVVAQGVLPFDRRRACLTHSDDHPSP